MVVLHGKSDQTFPRAANGRSAGENGATTAAAHGPRPADGRRLPPPRPAKGTAPYVQDAEQGREDDRDSLDTPQPAPALAKDQDDTRSATVRSELARDALACIGPVEETLGQVASATQIQLLKRALARCHPELAGVASEQDSLSIITLIESSLAQLTWKQYTRQRLQALRQALTLLYEKARVTYEDYQAVRKAFRSEHIETAPTFDLATFSPEDGEREEEEGDAA